MTHPLATDATGDSVALIALDLMGYVTAWNEAATRLFGFEADEALGQHLIFLLGDDSDALTEPGAWEPGVTETQHDVVLQHKGGEPVAARLALRLQRDADGEPTGMVAAYSPRQSAMADDDRMRLYLGIIDNSHQGVMVTDAQDQIVMVNPAFTRITGYSMAEALGKTPDILRSGKHGQIGRASCRERV